MLHVCMTVAEPLIVFHRVRNYLFLGTNGNLHLLDRKSVSVIANTLRDLQVPFSILENGFTEIKLSGEYHFETGAPFSEEFILYKGYTRTEVLTSEEYYQKYGE